MQRLIENRSFEAREAYGNPGRFYAVDDSGVCLEVAVSAVRGRGSVYAVCDRYSGVSGESALSAFYGKSRQDRVLQTRHMMAFDLEKDHTYQSLFLCEMCGI